MLDDTRTEIARIGLRLLDDAYLAWFSAESECEQALHAWFEGPVGSRGKQYAAYRAALDREEAAAHDLRRLSRLAEPCRDSLVRAAQAVSE